VGLYLWGPESAPLDLFPGHPLASRPAASRASPLTYELVAYLGSGKMIFLLARAAGVDLDFSMAMR